MRKGLMAATALVAATMGTAASATTFDFSFSAPFTNGDTATGSGTFEADELMGAYMVTDVSGTLSPYDGADAETITSISGGFLPVIIMKSGDTFWTAFASFGTDSRFLAFTGLGGSYMAMGLETFSRSATLTITERAAAPVPEPASWALMVVGFGLAGAALRRRTTVKFAQA